MAGHARRWADRATRALPAVVTLLLVATAVLLTTSFRALTVRSGSMEPGIRTGDLVVTRLSQPTDTRVGDVITFRDPSRQQELVTHRVVSVEEKQGKLAFVTKGDANTGTEQWTIQAEGTIGIVRLAIPKAGYALAWSSHPQVRVALLLTACALLAFAALRRIWTS